MKKILFVLLVAFCGVSFSFGGNSEMEDPEKAAVTKQCIKGKTLGCINEMSDNISSRTSSLDEFLSVTSACYKTAEKECAK